MSIFGLFGGGAPSTDTTDPTAIPAPAKPGLLDYIGGLLLNNQTPVTINQNYDNELTQRALLLQAQQQQAAMNAAMYGQPMQGPGQAPQAQQAQQAPQMAPQAQQAPQPPQDDATALLNNPGTPDSAGGVMTPIQSLIGGSAPVAPSPPMPAPMPAPMSQAPARIPRAFTNPDGTPMSAQQATQVMLPFLSSRLVPVATKAATLLKSYTDSLPTYSHVDGLGAFNPQTGMAVPGSDPGTKLEVTPSGIPINIYRASSAPQSGLGAPPVAGYQPSFDPQTGRFVGYTDPGGAVQGALATKAVNQANADNQARAATTPAQWQDSDGSTHYGSQAQVVGQGAPFGGVAPMPGAPVYRPQAQNPNGLVGPSTAADAEQKATGTNAAANAQAYVKAAELARARLVQLQRAQKLNDSGMLGQGAANPTAQNVASTLASFGARNPNLPLMEDYQNLTGNLFKTGAVVAGTDADTRGGNGMTNIRSPKEWQWMQSQYPNLNKTQAGRARILANEAADAKRIVSIGNAANNWIQRYGGLTARDAQGRTFEQSKDAYLSANPLAQ